MAKSPWASSALQPLTQPPMKRAGSGAVYPQPPTGSPVASGPPPAAAAGRVRQTCEFGRIGYRFSRPSHRLVMLASHQSSSKVAERWCSAAVRPNPTADLGQHVAGPVRPGARPMRSVTSDSLGPRRLPPLLVIIGDPTTTSRSLVDANGCKPGRGLKAAGGVAGRRLLAAVQAAKRRRELIAVHLHPPFGLAWGDTVILTESDSDDTKMTVNGSVE